MIARIGLPLALVLTAAVLVGPFGPLQTTYATSGSMEPAIDEGDIYFVIESSEIEQGDVILFDAPEFEQGVTHRVVGRTDTGFITKGDANPTTDQAAGQAAVTDAAVRGKVIEVNGHPLTIPRVGGFIEGVQSHRSLVAVLTAVLVVLHVIRSLAGERERPERTVIYPRDLLYPLLVSAIVLSFILIFWGMSTHEMMYVATTGEPTGQHTIPMGEDVTRELTVETFSLPFTTVLVDAEGMRIIDHQTSGSTTAMTVQLPAKTSPGPYPTWVRVYTFPATLPKSVLAALLEIHWAVAAAASIGPIFTPILSAYLLFIDPKAPLRRPRFRWLHRMGANQ